MLLPVILPCPTLEKEESLFVGCLTSQCILGTDLFRRLYVLPHGDRNFRSNLLSHSLTVY